MKGVYKFSLDCGRMGEIESIFVADSKDVKNAIGNQAYFGEVLGKHSEIEGTLEESQFKLLTTDKEFVQIFDSIEAKTGLNPLNYLS